MFNFKKIELNNENPIHIGPSIKRVPRTGLIDSGDYNITIQVNDPNDMNDIVVNMESFHENIKHIKETNTTLKHSIEDGLSKFDNHRMNLKESIYDLSNQISASYKGSRKFKSYCLIGGMVAAMFCMVFVLDGFETFLSMEIDDVTMEIKNVTTEMKQFQNQVLEKYDNVTNIPTTTVSTSYSSETSFSITFETSTAEETTSITTSSFPLTSNVPFTLTSHENSTQVLTTFPTTSTPFMSKFIS